MGTEEKLTADQTNLEKEVTHEDVTLPACMVTTVKFVTMHRECFEKVMELYLGVLLEANLYREALQGICKDYETISYQSDCIVAMWSKAKRALDAGVSTKRQPGSDGADLGGGLHP